MIEGERVTMFEGQPRIVPARPWGRNAVRGGVDPVGRYPPPGPGPSAVALGVAESLGHCSSSGSHGWPSGRAPDERDRRVCGAPAPTSENGQNRRGWLTSEVGVLETVAATHPSDA